MDAGYSCARSYDMPPTACTGIGIDRVVILSPNQPAMHDVTLIPHLRPAAK
jgi:lysyl-tRNA synthetase class II